MDDHNRRPLTKRLPSFLPTDRALVTLAGLAALLAIDCTAQGGGPQEVQPRVDGGASDHDAAQGSCGYGLPMCGDACVDLAEDARHCGGCGNACSSGSVCVSGVCRVGTCADVFKTACGPSPVAPEARASCVDLKHHPDHCGACGNRCAGGTVCDEGTCVAQVGSGESCTDPMVVRSTKPTVAFGLVGASADEAPLSCGDAQKRADRVFRWTATHDKTNVKARAYGIDTADLVIEVFAGSPCVAASSVGCNNDEAASTRLPEAEFAAKAGTTYFIVVSSFGPTPSGRFYLNVDD